MSSPRDSHGWRLFAAGIAAAACFLALGCAGSVTPVGEGAEIAERDRVESLVRSVETLAAARTNLGRYAALQRRIAELGLSERARSEGIDWFSLQRNVAIELPGRSARIVYVVAHYDKIDASPLHAASSLVNGLLDPLFSPLTLSSGAVDNATGVAVALELAAELAGGPLEHTYRILLVGSEESGLRGSRAHVARLSRAEKDAIDVAVVLDSVGLARTPNCVLRDVSDAAYVERALRAASRLGVPLETARLPAGASTDFEPFAHASFGSDLLRGLRFNLVGGLLPQRSWFTGEHRAPVLVFSGCDLQPLSDVILGQLLLPFGALHGALDRPGRVDARRLYEQLAIAASLIRELEVPEPGSAAGR